MSWVTMNGTHVNIEKGIPKTGTTKMKMSLVMKHIKSKHKQEHIEKMRPKTASSTSAKFDKDEYYSKESYDERTLTIVKMAGVSKAKAEQINIALSGVVESVTGDRKHRNIKMREGGWFYEGDKDIRKGTTPRDVEKAKLIDEFIMKSPKFSGPIYRGIALPREMAEKLAVGGKFVENGFLSSWTQLKYVAEGFADNNHRSSATEPVIFTTNRTDYAVAVHNLSKYASEGEVLVTNMHENEYRIKSVTRNKFNVLCVELE